MGALRYHENISPIRPELIHMSLNNGIVAEDDYLARSYNTLPDIVTEINEIYTTNDALPLEHLNDIFDPSYISFKYGEWLCSIT